MLLIRSETDRLEFMQTQESLFETAIRDHQQSLARIVATYELNPALQQELHQEILLAIWKSLANFRGDSSLHTFIFRVAHNQAINHVSRHSRTPNYEMIDDSDISNDESPESMAISNQKISMVFKAMHRLPLMQRQLLTLSLEGLSYQELSEVTGLSESNVGVKLNRAKKALQQQLEKYHV